MRIERVLIVDDEPEVLRLLGLVLKKQGYTPVTCLTGSEAIEQMNQKRFYLGLVDILLPDMDGMEIVKEGKKRNPLAAIFPEGPVTSNRTSMIGRHRTRGL